MSKSSETVLQDFEFRDEMVSWDGRPYVAPSPRLTMLRRGQPAGHLSYEVLEGGAKIFGAKLYEGVDADSRESTLAAMVEELARRTSTQRPILSIRKSRWPLADLWPRLKARDIIDIPAVVESL